MQRWLILFLVFVVIGVTVYAVNSLADKEDQQQVINDGEVLKNRTDLLLHQVNESLNHLKDDQEHRKAEHDAIINNVTAIIAKLRINVTLQDIDDDNDSHSAGTISGIGKPMIIN